MRDEAITADELERAKSYLVGSHQIAMQRRSAVANAMAYHEAYGLGWQSWADYDDAIRAVTAGRRRGRGAALPARRPRDHRDRAAAVRARRREALQAPRGKAPAPTHRARRRSGT